MKPLIIEFVGLPGCGKSTTVESLVSFWGKENVIVRPDITKRMYQIFGYSIFGFPIFIIPALIYYFFNPKYWKIKKCIYKFMVQYPVKQERLMVTLFLIYFYENLQKKLNNGKIIILDEGLIQFISSIPHDLLVDNNNQLTDLLDKLNYITKDILFVDCNLQIGRAHV